MAKTFDQIISDIRKHSFAPVYFLMGEEPFFIDMIADALEDEVVSEEEKAFNQIIMYGADIASIDQIGSAARSFPMMGERLLVIVREAQLLDKTIENLEKYLAVIPPSTVLCICYKYKKLDKRKALAKAIDKRGILFESKKLYDNNMPDWISGQLASRGYKATPKALQMIADSLGNDLNRICTELDKLIIKIPKSKTITDDDIEQNVGISKDYNVFELQKAIGSRDVVKATRIINYFGDNPKANSLVGTVAILYAYFTKLVKYHASVDKSDAGLASMLGVSPYFLKDYKEAARNYSPNSCVRCIEVLHDFDLKSKGYGISTNVEVKDLYREMLFKLMHV